MSDLRDRARGGEVATTRGGEMRSQIQQMMPQFQRAMPKGVEAQQLVRDALSVMSSNPALATCDPRTVLGGLMTCAQLGLRPGVLGQAWLIPFGGKAQLVIGYKGWVSLAQRSGLIANISMRVVRQFDEFDYAFGLVPELRHKPATGDRGEPVYYYAVVQTTNGGTYYDVMTKAECEEHRDRFAMAKKGGKVFGPWVDHFDAMALKTVLLRTLNLAPMDTELRQTAIAADESYRVNVDPDAEITATVFKDAPPQGVDTETGEISEATPVDDPPGWIPGTDAS